MVPALVTVAFLVLPLAGLLIRAPWTSLGQVLAESQVVEALRLSLICATAATVLSLLFGVPLAWVLARATFRGRGLLRALVLLPLVLPPVVGGVALLLAFGRRGVVGQYLDAWFGVTLPFTTLGVVIAETFVAMPFLIVTVEGAFRTADRGYEEAAATLGASRLTVFRRVTLPLIGPSLVAGSVLCWARALGEFGATITFAGNFPGRTQTMPIAVYLALERDPEAAIALSLVLLVVSVAVLVGLRDRWLTDRHRTMTLELDVVVRRGSFTLEVAAEVAPGEVLGVLGPNGAGKTSLLRALAGLNAVSEGSIRLGDQVLDDAATGTFVPAEQRPVGLVFQNYRLFPHLSVRDNVAFSARSRGTHRKQARQYADRYLHQLDLTALASHKPEQLSGGQAQRVALARALAADPGLLLLDEPLAALDARTRLYVRSELRRYLADFPGPVLIVTHDPLEAMVMADRLLVIEDGRVVQHGTPAEVARRPATQYVARLVSLNLYPGTLESADGTVRLAAGGSLTAAPGAPLPAVGTDVLVAVRPSAISVHTERPEHASPRNVWPGTIAGLELLADRVRAQINGQPDVLVDLTPAAVADLGLRPGQQVWLSAKATEVDVYAEPREGGRTEGERDGEHGHQR